MNLQYLNWKLFLDNPADAEPHEYFKVWNQWLPDSPEVFVDVADYAHVGDGPVIIIVGHYLNLSLDLGETRLGLLYDYKQPMEGDNAAKLKSTLLGVLRAAKRLETEADFSPSKKPRFNTGELRLTVNSRALAPNTVETFAALKGEISKALALVFGENGFELRHLPDPRQRFSVHVTAKNAPKLDDMLKRLA